MQIGYAVTSPHEAGACTATRGRVPLTIWQIDYTGPLPKAQRTSYTLTTVDTATGLWFHDPVLPQTKNILSKFSNVMCL